MNRVPVLGLALVLAAAAPSGHAASLTLTDEEVTRALEFGGRSVTVDAPFDQEWRVTNAAGEMVVVMTPFHRLAVAARHAAFKNEPLKPSEPRKVLKDQHRLPVWVQLKGPREDFSRYYAPRLIVNDREIEPTFVQNERSALRQDGGFVARCLYGFPTKDLAGTSRVVLVVRDGERREVSRFEIDLAAMR